LGVIGEPFALPPTTRENTPVVDAVRGFVFSSGRNWFNEHGLMDRYVSFLPEHVQELIFSVTALEWIPIAEAMECYDACDRLELPEAQQRELGRIVSSANNGRLLETIGRLAGGLGVAPWAPLKSLHKVWLRSNRGGAAAVFRLSERSARIELWRVPMARSPFFCTSMCGALEAGLALFRKKASVVDTKEATSDDEIILRATW
jgi:hypothetical protein